MVQKGMFPYDVLGRCLINFLFTSYGIFAQYLLDIQLIAEKMEKC